MNSHLRREVRDLALVAAGAIPGALLRWRLDVLVMDRAHLLANFSGCLLMGMLLAQPSGRSRLYLWGGIGLCGSLTTYSSWMLALVRELEQGLSVPFGVLLFTSLVGGLALVQVGYMLVKRLGPSI